MKKLVLTAFLLFSLWGNSQSNKLLDGSFWKNNPSLDLVKAEIEKGNNPAEANGGNHDVVSMAINTGASFDVIKFLVEQKGNSVNKKTHDGRIYLHWAANKGNIELVKYLISKGSSLTEQDDKAATPLSFAAANGQVNPELYNIFFKAGVSPKQVYGDGANILLLAIANDKDLKLTDFLSTKGISLKSTDALGRTAFDYAARVGNTDLLQKLLNKGVKATDNALIFAAQGSRMFSAPIETYKYLIENVKLNPNAVGENGETALHYLVKKKNHQEIVNYFLSKKVDVNKVDKSGNTAFMSAASGKELPIVELLYPLVKNINQVNNNGENALHLAVKSSSPEVIRFLLSKNIDTKAVAKDGNLAFSLVQSYRKPRPGENAKEFEEKLNLVEKIGVSFSDKLKNGSTLYHIAVIKNDLNLIKLLENKGIDINAKDENGMTALHKSASVSKDDSILKYLISQGADKTLTTDLEETAYDLAQENEALKAGKIDVQFLK